MDCAAVGSNGVSTQPLQVLREVHLRSASDVGSVPERYFAEVALPGNNATGPRTVGKAFGLDARTAALAHTARERVFGWRRKAATAGAALLALGMAYGVMFGHNGVTAFAHKRKETSDLQQQMQQLQVENDRLHERVNHLQSDPAAIEHQAREDLHYTRAGEVIVTLPNRAASQARIPQE